MEYLYNNTSDDFFFAIYMVEWINQTPGFNYK